MVCFSSVLQSSFEFPDPLQDLGDMNAKLCWDLRGWQVSVEVEEYHPELVRRYMTLIYTLFNVYWCWWGMERLILRNSASPFWILSSSHKLTKALLWVQASNKREEMLFFSSSVGCSSVMCWLQLLLSSLSIWNLSIELEFGV